MPLSMHPLDVASVNSRSTPAKAIAELLSWRRAFAMLEEVERGWDDHASE